MKNELRTYKKNEVVIFRSTKQIHGGLSNMAGGYVLKVNDVIILSSEALYQACRYPHLPEVQEQILAEKSPMTAKMISKKYYKETRQDWDKIRFKVMYWCLQVKLSQNWEKFYKELQATGKKPIVEYSEKDKVWAACPINSEELQGINALGRLLMKLREEFVLNDNFLECVSPPDIDNFNLLGFPIETVCNPVLEIEEYSILLDSY